MMMRRICALFMVLAVCELCAAACSDHVDCNTCAPRIGVTCRWCPADAKCHTAGAVATNPCMKSENIVNRNQCYLLEEPHFAPFSPSAVEGSYELKATSYGRWCGAMYANHPTLDTSAAMRLFFRAAHDVVRDLNAAPIWFQTAPAKMNKLSDTLYRTNLAVFQKQYGQSHMLYPQDLTTPFNGTPFEWAIKMVENEQATAERFIEQTFTSTEIASISADINGFFAPKKNSRINWARACIGGDIDFGNMKHREAIGIAMVYYIQYGDAGKTQYLASARCVH
eukprot:TRINITY_DN18162_c0_g1_i1.p1 TRINITY_DN18162_c0_g1~~TRINITY_DN18162_c0_g1_i1.p1  ORF type:complete len:297 (+),score=69.35 TRINITY_DN18162_c0_g1_i1:51-893(+)